MKFSILLLSIWLVSLPCIVQAAEGKYSDKIFVSKAWVRALPPSQKSTAAYMVIQNNNRKEVYLKSASSDAAEVVETHEMSFTKGMMNMAQVDGIKIRKGKKAILKPGGLHLMLINLKKPLHAGDQVPISLHFNDGSQKDIVGIVKEEANSEEKSCCLIPEK